MSLGRLKLLVTLVYTVFLISIHTDIQREEVSKKSEYAVVLDDVPLGPSWGLNSGNLNTSCLQ